MARATRKHIFPWRYGMFLALLASMAPLAMAMPWHEGVMAGFDIAALAFLFSLAPLLDADAGTMRRHARDNDANRVTMLLLTSIVSTVILVAVGVAVTSHDAPDAPTIVLLLTTLIIAWIFSNTVYALHYAHICYISEGDTPEAGGIDFPNSEEPNYWDFIYFAFTLGMTFQTSDVSVTNTPVRKTVIFHCLAAFVFNLGVIAFTINILGGG
ncbi:DUF1345 domain-containing protein [Sphingobium sp. SCG-1]|uniref:DUF1345 domain-containing protein n=1 Tax=Sphingobium sp. SCG-1 TaxID=2072936 RepID=UPI000CD6AA81|nr:DUF1345 domain-containing protein [Sphingobium sp. SCG-1]AUW57605.1 DUF1345 domain-containing protein [Sphingobium sp. SCG-1]